MSFFGELNRRNVVRMAVLYVVAGWVVLQIADVLLEPLGLPDWTFRLVLGLLLLGFPFALIFAWVFELTPEGLKRERDIGPGRSVVRQTGNKMNVAIIVLLVLAIAGLVVDRILPERSVGPERGAELERSAGPERAAAPAGEAQAATVQEPVAAEPPAAAEPLHFLRYTALAIFQHVLGDPQKAQQQLDAMVLESGDSAAYQYAQIYAQWGETDNALTWLETAVRIRDPGILQVANDRLFISLRGEPRFQQVLRAAGHL
jgi:hypothetical protein